MKLLLDTSTFLWIGTGDARLSKRVATAFEDPEAEVWLSAVSAWEITVKHGLGKLPLPVASAEEFVTGLREALSIPSLPLDEASAFVVARLPPIHRDPFDRMLVAQAITHGLVLATSDATVRSYPVRSLW